MKNMNGNLPQTWRFVALGDVLEKIEAGTSFKAQDRPAINGELGVLKLSAVTWNKFRPSENKALFPECDPGACPNVKKGDLLISRANTTELIAAVVMVEEDHPNLLLSDKTLRLVPKSGLTTSSYLLHLLRTPFLRDHFERHATGTSGSMRNISQANIVTARIPLPPLPEQRQIAAILDKADAIRRKREEGIRLTEELLRSTFLEMFGDPATNPKGWDTEILGELASIRRGSSPRPIENYMGGDVPWIKIGDATKGDSFYITDTADHVTQAGAEKSVLLEPGALVIANSGVSLGFARILKIKGCVHDGWLSLENLDDRLNKIYLLRLVNCLTDYFRAIAPDGTQPNLNTGIMKEFRVAIPPIDLQRQFEKAAYAIVEMTAARKKATSEAQALFGSLVQRAFRGEL